MGSNLGRRGFLRLASIGLAGAALAPAASAAAGMMGGGGGGMGGGTTIINPPPGLTFTDPPLAYRNPATGIIELEMRERTVDINGTSARLMTYCDLNAGQPDKGLFPGPEIRVRKGDMLKVNLKNSLPGGTTNILGHERGLSNLHTHGLHVSPERPADSMDVMLMNNGEEFPYEYDLSYEEPGHTCLYHPHVHGLAAEQYWAGLAGPLVVEDDTGLLTDFETHTLFIKDITVTGGLPEPHATTMDYMRGKEGNTVLVNGLVNPRLAAKPGQVQRWRVVNACNARFFMLSLEGHTMHLVGTDGGLLDRPYPLSRLLLSPGERADILIKVSATKKSYRLLSLPYNRGGSALQQVTLLTVDVSGNAATGESVPRIINETAKREPWDSSMPRRTITLSMMRGRGYINNVSFEGMDKAFKITSDMDTWEVWDIYNQSGMDHPFHQHVNAAQVLAVSGGDAGYASLYTKAPAWKDTVVVPKWGSVRLLVPVMDWHGMAMFHCHIMEHEDIGMMGVWDIGMPM